MIIYRDLKPANILVFSLSLSSLVSKKIFFKCFFCLNTRSVLKVMRLVVKIFQIYIINDQLN